MGELQKLSIGEFLDDVRGVVASPGRRFSVIHERGVLWGSLFLLIAPAYFPFAYLGGIYFDREPFPGYSLLLPAVAAGLFSYLKVFCIHVVARLLEGKGRYFAATGRLRNLFVLIGYTGVPSIIALIIALIVFILVPGQIGYLLRSFHVAVLSAMIAVGISLFIWNLILMVLALRNVYPMRDIKIVTAVVLGPVIFAGPALSMHLLIGSAEVNTAYLAPILNERMMRLFAADPSAQEARPARIDIHIDRLAFKYREPKRFDLAIFDPAQETSGKEGQRQGGIVVGRAGVTSGRKNEKTVGRIVGLPGERVEITKGKLYINSRPWAEPYVAPEWQSNASVPSRMLGASEYFVLPEDRHLLDSGYGDIVVPRARIAGRMVTNKFPLGWWLLRPTATMKGYPEFRSSPP